MHVQMIPPSTPPDPEDAVDDNLRLAYRTTPLRGVPLRLQELLAKLREAAAGAAAEGQRPAPRRKALRTSRL